MTEVRFYHLQKQTLDQALPQILTKALSIGHRIVVKLGSKDSVEHMNKHLWTYRQDSFLPHGSAKDGHAEYQPIWLTAENDNPNNADLLVTGGGAIPDSIEDYKLCCEFLDGFDDDAITQARERWKSYKDKGFEVTYWQQDDKGAWNKKA
ncbi:MAG: DNA polymerase III subunit chi [Pseudomonadota bacterium]